MIAYVRMQLLRWLRRTLGIGLLVGAVFLPTLMSALHLLFGMTGSQQAVQRSIVSIVVTCALTASGLSLVNQLSALVEEEARLRRSALLRIGDLDGYRAVGAYALLGSVLAFLHGTVAYAGPAFFGLFLGVPLRTWLAPSLLTTLLLSTFGPPAILAAFLLPRVLGIVVLNAAAFVAGIALAVGLSFEPGALSAGFLAAVLAFQAAFLAGGGLLWRAKSTALW